MGPRSVTEKPQAVLVPFPTKGHIDPPLKLAQLVHHRGFHISFVSTEHNHKRLLKSRGSNSLDGLSTFVLKSFPMVSLQPILMPPNTSLHYVIPSESTV